MLGAIGTILQGQKLTFKNFEVFLQTLTDLCFGQNTQKNKQYFHMMYEQMKQKKIMLLKALINNSFSISDETNKVNLSSEQLQVILLLGTN